jgi:hypothetical protein
VTWVRAAFQAKDASAIHDLILWSEKLQDWEETQRNSFNFVSKCSAKR